MSGSEVGAASGSDGGAASGSGFGGEPESVLASGGLLGGTAE